MDLKKLSEQIAKALSESPEVLALLQPEKGAVKRPRRLTREERKSLAKKQFSIQTIKKSK